MFNPIQVGRGGGQKGYLRKTTNVGISQLAQKLSDL